MTSFPDIYEVEIDEDNGQFTVIRNSGTVQTYYIEDEPSFFNNIMQSFDGDIYEVKQE